MSVIYEQKKNNDRIKSNQKMKIRYFQLLEGRGRGREGERKRERDRVFVRERGRERERKVGWNGRMIRTKL
jgi:hypothetical protein